MNFNLALVLVILVCRLPIAYGDEAGVTVRAESEVPALQGWADQTRAELEKWHPRICNLLPTKEFTATREVTLQIKKSDAGIASTSGNVITVSSHWIEKHPDDVGLAVHELVHVIQAYPSGEPWWVTEGVADYIRWAIFEGKPQNWFPRPSDAQGYRKGYRVAAGFLLWLESDSSPGIVKKLNTAMRRGKYSDDIFKQETGRSLDELWNAYRRSE